MASKSGSSAESILEEQKDSIVILDQRVSIVKEEKDNILILDGGFSSQLATHVTELIDGDVLWSSRFLATNPEAVIETHLDFLRAGADVITTNTYQASTGAFMKYLNLTELDSYNLIKSAVTLAQTACTRYLKELPPGTNCKPIIAGSVGPYGACLHDGSEYTGAYAKTTSVQTMRDWHKPRVIALIEGGVHILAFETIPCQSEAEMLVDLIKEYPQIKAWLSFNCRSDGKSIANGENFQEVAKICYDLNPEQIIAIGVNCISPQSVEPLISGLNDERENNRIPIIVYPNSGETYENYAWLERDQCEPLHSYILKWLDLGVTYVGGCCRTFAEDIRQVKSEVVKWQKNKYKVINNVSDDLEES